jgi:hypothetical protein
VSAWPGALFDEPLSDEERAELESLRGRVVREQAAGLGV